MNIYFLNSSKKWECREVRPASSKLCLNHWNNWYFLDDRKLVSSSVINTLLIEEWFWNLKTFSKMEKHVLFSSHLEPNLPWFSYYGQCVGEREMKRRRHRTDNNFLSLLYTAFDSGFFGKSNLNRKEQHQVELRCQLEKDGLYKDTVFKT